MIRCNQRKKKVRKGRREEGNTFQPFFFSHMTKEFVLNCHLSITWGTMFGEYVMKLSFSSQWKCLTTLLIRSLCLSNGKATLIFDIDVRHAIGTNTFFFFKSSTRTKLSIDLLPLLFNCQVKLFFSCWWSISFVVGQLTFFVHFFYIDILKGVNL